MVSSPPGCQSDGFFLEGFLVWRWIKSCATNCAAYYVTTIPAHCQLRDGDKTSCIEGLSNIRLAWVIEINIDQPWLIAFESARILEALQPWQSNLGLQLQIQQRHLDRCPWWGTSQQGYIYIYILLIWVGIANNTGALSKYKIAQVHTSYTHIHTYKTVRKWSYMRQQCGLTNKRMMETDKCGHMTQDQREMILWHQGSNS